MNLPLALKIAEVVGILLGATAFALVNYWRMKEKAFTRARGLDENPVRCDQHEQAINSINMAIVGIGKDIQNMKDDIAELKGKRP
jgi:hypothetical protein